MLVNPKTGGIHMLGRSDGTLNPSGVRFGSAEIYNIVQEFTEVGSDNYISGNGNDLLCYPRWRTVCVWGSGVRTCRRRE